MNSNPNLWLEAVEEGTHKQVILENNNFLSVISVPAKVCRVRKN